MAAIAKALNLDLDLEIWLFIFSSVSELKVTSHRVEMDGGVDPGNVNESIIQLLWIDSIEEKLVSLYSIIKNRSGPSGSICT